MTCHSPIYGWQNAERNENGKREITFRRTEGFGDWKALSLPCGQCIGCRLDNAQSWAIRCYHEAQLHDWSSFITLTYDEEHIPDNNSLKREHLTKFLKRLRKSLNHKISVFACGEYGDETERPHYHALIFGWDFPDKKFHKFTKDQEPMFTSEKLERLWSEPKPRSLHSERLGQCSLGAATFRSASYVARYVSKKITGPKAEEHYRGRLPEFATQSLRPAIGLNWIKNNWKEVYPCDFVICEGKKMNPPRFYDEFIKVHHPTVWEIVERKRRINCVDSLRQGENSERRLRVRGVCTKSRLNSFKREV